MVRSLKYRVILVPETILGHRSGTVESKLRQLVMKLEYVESLAIAHPFIKGIDQETFCLTDEEVRTVAEGTKPPSALEWKKENYAGEGKMLYMTTFYIGLAVEPKQGKQPVQRVSCDLPVLVFFSRWTEGTAEVGHLIPDERIYENGEDVG